jgi:cytochrome P450
MQADARQTLWICSNFTTQPGSQLEPGGSEVSRHTKMRLDFLSAPSFERASEMDLRRSPNTHITFGVGPHSCVGQALARTELQTVPSVLLRRLPPLELAVPVEALPRREGLIVGGLERVLVRW